MELHSSMELWRCLMNALSITFTIVTDTLYTINSHINLGSMSFYKSRALNFPGKPHFWIFLIFSAGDVIPVVVI